MICLGKAHSWEASSPAQDSKARPWPCLSRDGPAFLQASTAPYSSLAFYQGVVGSVGRLLAQAPSLARITFPLHYREHWTLRQMQFALFFKY